MQNDDDAHWKEPSSLEKNDLYPQDAFQDVALVPSPPSTPTNLQQPRGPHLKTSSPDAFQPQLDVDAQANNIRARERVEILRGRVFRSRRKIQDVREDVRQLRERQREASAELMKATYQLMALDNVQSLESLRPLFKKASDTQDELGPVEEAYDRLESRLSYEEQELEQEEKFFYTHNNISLRPLPDEELERSLSPLIKPYEPENEPQDVSLDDENVQAYLLQMAKAHALKDSLDKMEMDYYKVTEEARFRRRHDLDLSRESATFLSKYDNVHQAMTHELYDVEDELYNLRDRCLDLYLFGEDDYVYTRRDALVEDIMESVNEARERSPLRTAAQRHLHEPDFSDKRDYVNVWMLEAVQDSTFEAHRLRAYIYFEFAHPPQRDDQREDQEIEQAKELNEDQWPDLAMSLWDKDAAGTRTNEIYMLSRMDEITGGTETDFRATTKLSDGKSFRSDKKDRSVSFEEEYFVDIETIDVQAESVTTKRPEFTPNTTEQQPPNDVEIITSASEKFQGLQSAQLGFY